MTASTTTPMVQPLCPQCRAVVGNFDLACPTCGMLLYIEQLEEWSRRALSLEVRDPRAAAQCWHECLGYLPPDAPQARQLIVRIQQLLASGDTGLAYAAPPPSALKAVALTLGSMVLSMAVYASLLGPPFAIGFVLLILIHEMGHVLALRHFGIRSSPPVFIPYLGAVITVPPLPNAYQEALVGIGGPVFGLIGALICFAAHRTLHQDILLQLAFYGALMNLFNLLPIPPLDGGRVMAAVSTWAWPLCLLVITSFGVYQWVHGHHDSFGLLPMLTIVVLFGLPRLWETFARGGRRSAYYRISRMASWSIGLAYVLLAAGLAALALGTQSAADLF